MYHPVRNHVNEKLIGNLQQKDSPTKPRRRRLRGTDSTMNSGWNGKNKKNKPFATASLESAKYSAR